MVAADAARPDGPRVAHAEHGRRVARAARLEMANQPLQLLTHGRERHLEVDALSGREVVGREPRRGDGEKCAAKAVELVAADREPRGHRVTAVLLEVRTALVQRAVKIESGNAAPRAAAELPSLIPADQKRRAAVALHEPRGDDPD